MRRPVYIDPKSSDVVVLGAGVIGLSIAWRAAQRGMSVTVADPAPAHGASYVAAGMLAPVTEAEPGEEELLQLNLFAADVYPAFVAELEEESGRSVGFRSCGTLMVAPEPSARSLLDELHRWRIEIGVPVTRLTASECRTLEPALSPRVTAGLFAEGDHQVDNRALLEALVEACRSSGVDLVTDRVDSIELREDRVVGVSLRASGSITAGEVVVAMGARSGSIAGLPPEAQLPVRPVKGQLVHLGRPGDAPSFRCNIRTPDAYLVARDDGRLVVGATVEERGFDTRVTADAVRELLDAAYEVLPAALDREFAGAIAGLRPALPDNKPAIGRGVFPGLVWATGHYRNGILLAPVTAEAVVDLLDTGYGSERLVAFTPERFAGSRVK